MKKIVLFLIILFGFGCSRTTIPSDDFVKECTLSKHYYEVKMELVGLVCGAYERTRGWSYDEEIRLLGQIEKTLPDSEGYVRKNLSKVKILSITREKGDGKCIATVNYKPDITGNEFFDKAQDKQNRIRSVDGLYEYKLNLSFDERQHKWFLEKDSE